MLVFCAFVATGGALLMSPDSASAQQPAPPSASDARLEALERRFAAFERETRAELETMREKLDARTNELEVERARRRELEARVDADKADTPSPDATAVAPAPQKPDTAATTPDAAPGKQVAANRQNDRPDPLKDLPMKGGDLIGNVYSGDAFRVRIGGSIRTNFQFNTTPVGDQVGRALLPDPSIPGGGDNAGRGSFRALASFSRMFMAIQGPTTLGGKTFGYLEFDFARNLSGGDIGAVNPNPRIRHAYLRWTFDDVGGEGKQLALTFGQNGGYSDLIPDTVDFGAMTGGLGVVLRRNPRATIAYAIPTGDSGHIVLLGGIERPLLGNDVVGGDLGNGEVGEIPVLSFGAGYETTRRLELGDSFGLQSLKFGARYATGRFVERFAAGTLEPDFNLQTNFDERRFAARAIHGGIALDGIGFNAESRARTLTLRIGGLWTAGEASYLDAAFDRRVVLGNDGGLDVARSAGGFVNPMFHVTDHIDIRWAGGVQWALDPSRPVVTGTLTNDFFRTRNWQSEISAWWTPGPFTFAVAYNFTKTNYRRIDFLSGAGTDLVNDNGKFEAICWFSF